MLAMSLQEFLINRSLDTPEKEWWSTRDIINESRKSVPKEILEKNQQSEKERLERVKTSLIFSHNKEESLEREKERIRIERQFYEDEIRKRIQGADRANVKRELNKLVEFYILDLDRKKPRNHKFKYRCQPMEHWIFDAVDEIIKMTVILLGKREGKNNKNQHLEDYRYVQRNLNDFKLSFHSWLLNTYGIQSFDEYRSMFVFTLAKELVHSELRLISSVNFDVNPLIDSIINDYNQQNFAHDFYYSDPRPFLHIEWEEIDEERTDDDLDELLRDVSGQ